MSILAIVHADETIRRHLPGLLLLVAFLISLALFLIWPPERIARTLFFPGTTEVTLTGERRLLPRVVSRERAMELVVEDLILGPALITHGRALPRETRMQSLILSEDTVYIDLSPEVLFHSEEVRIDLRGGLAAVEKSLRYNFRRVEEVVLTINGQVPFYPPHEELQDSLARGESR